MKNVLLYVACSIPIISMILLIMCGELPTDPKDNPDNVDATFFNASSSSINYQDQPVEIGIIIRYPALTKKIRISFADTLPKETLYCDTKQNEYYDTVKAIRTFSDTGKKKMNVDVDLTSGSVKQFSYEFEITPKLLTVSFDTIPPNGTIETGKPDTMTFTASTSPTGGAIDFTVESQPVLNSSNLKILDLGSKAIVITTATHDTTYNITIIAMSGRATKSTMVKLKSEKKLILQEKSSVTTMPSGTSDTLVFSIGVAKSDTINSVVILNATAFKTGEIVPVVTGKDTLSFVFTPAESKVYTFSVEVAMNYKKDTLSYNISVIKESTLLLKQDTVTISATEGKILNIPLVPYLTDTTVQLSADKGAVNGKTLVYTVPSSTTRDTIIVTAQKKSTTSKMKIYLNINNSDTPKFSITYLGNGDTGGAVPIDGTGYEKDIKVTIAGNTGLLVKPGSTFSGWNTLADGTGTAYLVGSELTIGSANVILYAHWAVNTVQPSIVTQPISQTVCAGLQVNFSVMATGTTPLLYQWRKDDVVLTSQPDSSTLTLSNVTPANAGVYTVKIWNNTDSVISTACKLRVLPKTPAAPSATVRTAFSIGVSWSTTDGAMWYRLLRSSNSSAFASICSTSQTSTIDTPLVEGGSYLYRIVAGNNDGLSDTSTAISATTFNGPSITTPLHDLSVVVGQPITLTVGATGTPTCTYLWKKDGGSDTIGTAATLTILQAALSDAGNYEVVVTNSVRSVKSSAVVTILPTYLLTLTQSPPAGCSVTMVKDTAVYISGPVVTLTATAPAGSGYRFDKWSGDTLASGNVLSIVMRKNRMITPIFVKLYTLTLSTLGATKGTVSSTAGNGPFTVDSGATVPITATPNSEYKFKQWSVTAGLATFTSASTASTSVKVLGNTTVQAGFGCITFRKDFPADYAPWSVVQGDDGSYGVLGQKLYTGVLVKLDANGSSVWEKTVCNLDAESPSLFPISKIPNGFLGGASSGGANYSTLIGISTNVSTTPLFTWNTYTDPNTAIQPRYALGTNNGGYFIGGYGEYGDADLRIKLIKTDASRQKLWTMYIDSLSGIYDCQQTSDNGFVMVDRGYSVVKINSTGTITNFSTRFADISAWSVRQISEVDGYIVGGEKTNSGAALVKLTPDGTIASGWPKNYSMLDFIVSVRVTSDGNFVFATRGGVCVKTNPNGDIIWDKKLTSNSIKYMDICRDGGFIIVSDSWIIKTDENGNVE